MCTEVVQPPKFDQRHCQTEAIVKDAPPWEYGAPAVFPCGRHDTGQSIRGSRTKTAQDPPSTCCGRDTSSLNTFPPLEYRPVSICVSPTFPPPLHESRRIGIDQISSPA